MNRWLYDLITGVGILATMLASAAVVAAVAGFAAVAGSWPWYLWVTLAPALYLGWLVVFLSISAVSCRLIGRRYPKPRHTVFHPGLDRDSREMLGLATARMCYRRLAMLQSIPFVSLLSQFRPLDTLVFRSYAPSVHIGRNLSNWGVLYDPDLTEIGDGVVLGGRAAVAAHTMAIRGDGAVYASAPVRIGDRVTIGGEARVSLGCVIGDDAIVEPGAVVEPFTRIPAGEVWGGNPARLRRRREDLGSEQSGRPAPAGDDARSSPGAAAAGPERPSGEPARDRARRLVVDALGLAPDQAAGELGSESCPLWDSFGQVVIAAALFDGYGITVDGPEIFRLKTLDDVAALLAREERAETPVPAATSPVAEATSLPDDLELLPLLDPQTATRLLAAARNGETPDGAPLRVSVAASFTAQPLEPTLRLWGRAFGLDLDCRFAGFDQIVQALLDPEGPTGAGSDGVTVVLTRPEDLPPDAAEASSALDQLLDAVEHAVSRRSPGSRLVVGTLPPVVSSFATLDGPQADAIRHRWRSRLAAIDGVELFEFSRVVERVGIEDARSSQLEVLARSGYSQRLHQELAIALVRQIRTARGRPAKVVAVDCDDTLWGGVLGEVGADGLQLGPDGAGRSFQLFQRHLKRLKERGLLLAVVSRNEEADVREVFAQHPGMVLRADDIAAWRVNWEHKSENLRHLADELSLGLDSFVFLDDDPATRMEVKLRTPAVHVVPLPEDAAGYCETLDRLWLFDGAPPTAVDATRTQKAQDEQHRLRERESAVSLEDFLARLELEVDLARAGERDLPRVAQLTQRTNQFNLSLRRRTLDEARALAAETEVLVLEARDRFGDYGQVGVCVLGPSTEPDCRELETLLMSCRALGRGIEDAFLHGIAGAAADEGATALLAPYVPGARNGLVRDFLARTGFEEIRPDVWRLSIEQLPPLPAHVRWHAATAAAAASGEGASQ